jgi:hypothetical protein
MGNSNSNNIKQEAKKVYNLNLDEYRDCVKFGDFLSIQKRYLVKQDYTDVNEINKIANQQHQLVEYLANEKKIKLPEDHQNLKDTFDVDIDNEGECRKLRNYIDILEKIPHNSSYPINMDYY